MSDLPEDLIIGNILSRLPVKTLLQLRCVSKTWCSLMNTPSFIKLHLNQSIKNKTHLNLVFNGKEHLYSTELDPLNTLLVLNHPFNGLGGITTVIGCCNGLLLLCNNGRRISIWNMWIRKFHKLPDMRVASLKNRCSLTYGFGYDHIGDDYKVVRIVQFYDDKLDIFCSDVEIYSLKSNSWREIRELPYYLCFGCGLGVFANGALHWFVKERRRSAMPRLIVAFDLGTEEYGLLPRPECLDGNCDMSLDLLGGCICVTYSHDMNEHISVWVMKEYGVEDSWTKLVLVKPPNVLIHDYLKPLAYSKGGDEILFNCDGERLVRYDLAGKTFKEIAICGQRCLPYSYHVAACVGSLVPPDGFGQIDRANNPNKRRKLAKE